MAYQDNAYGLYGNGSLGDVTDPSSQINSYANVSAFTSGTFTIGTPSVGVATFSIGAQVLLHISATSNSSTTYLGCYAIATIIGVNGSVITIDKDLTTILMPSAQLSNYYMQAIVIAQYHNLTLTTSTIAPLSFNATNKYGGILAFKCSNTLSMSGSGKINLTGSGIPAGSIALRPATSQEGTASQAGWENSVTPTRFLLNCPDGAVFIMAKTFAQTGTSVRIGGSSAGTQYYPYVSGAVDTTPVKGGPTILLCAPTITGFDASIISKSSSNTSGRGLGRCYIATNPSSLLPADEGLYAVDCVSNPLLLSTMNIKDYGQGTYGTVTNPSGQLNSYVNVTAVSSDGLTLTVGSTPSNGAYETFTTGKCIMFHVSRRTGSDGGHLGKFILAKIVSVNGTTIVIDTPIINIVPYTITSNYKCQIVTVAQFSTLIISNTYTATLAYNTTYDYGGIFAAQCSSLCDLQGGVINVASAGIPYGTSRPVETWESNGTSANKLPLSIGGGAIFIVAKTSTWNTSTRLGATNDGSLYGGSAGACDTKGNPGAAWQDDVGNTGYSALNDSSAAKNNPARFPGQGGTQGTYDGTTGVRQGPSTQFNFGVNSLPLSIADWQTGQIAKGLGGPSVFFVANTISGFSIKCVATGGPGGQRGLSAAFRPPANTATDGGPGGAGYPGGGGGGGAGFSSFNGGSGANGGLPGVAFIYVNTLTSPDYTAYLNY